MSSTRKDTSNMVTAIQKGDNVKAYSLLEKIMKQKVLDKISNALKNATSSNE